MERFRIMKKLCLAVSVALVASFSVLVSSPAQAQDYQLVVVNVSERTVVGGNNIEITATANIKCDSWELTFLDQEASKGSSSFITHVFTTPEVDDEEDHVATATCFYDDGVSAMGSGGGGRALGTLATVETSAEGSGTQTLLPEDDDDDDDDDDGDGDDDGNGGGDGDNGGLLPNTGGERLAWLIIGGMLVLVGGGVVVASRRRDA
jgi:LPXTG-motif cell wall-anchored protein